MSLALSAVRRLLPLLPRSTDSVETLHAAIAARAPEAPVSPAVRRVAHVSERLVEGFRVVRLEPRRRRAQAHLVYAHGGCYTFPLRTLHWNLLAHLIAAADVSVDVPLYGLAPEHTAAEAYRMLDSVYADALDTGLPVHLSGDSAGGGLALGQAIRLRDAGLPAPRGLLLIAPWLDARVTDPAVAALAPLDPLLAPAGLAEAGRLWAGDLDVTDARVSPLLGDLAGLPPTLVIVGDHDILLADAKALGRRMHVAGSPLELRITRGGFHVFPAVAALPESRLALRRMAAALRAAPPAASPSRG